MRTRDLFVTCREASTLLSELVDGNLSIWQAFLVRCHLLFCPDCRAVLATLRALPRLAGGLEVPAPREAEAALDGALARISQHGTLRPWPATPVPAEAQALLEGQPDLPLAILAAAHQTVARNRGPVQDPYHLPEGLRGLLPPEHQWHWVEGPKGKRRTVLLEDPSQGQKLILAYSPVGARARAHRHLGSESILILAGTMNDQGLALTPGAWIHHPAGSVHAPEIREEACWCLIREEGGIAAATTIERLKLMRSPR